MKEHYVTAEDIFEEYGISKAKIARYSSVKYCKENNKKRFPRPVVKGRGGRQSVWSRAEVYLWKINMEEDRYKSTKPPVKIEIPKVTIPYWPLPNGGLVEL